MISLKKELKALLDPLCPRVYQTWPQEIKEFPTIIFAETNNTPYFIDNKHDELQSTLQYTIHIFTKNQSPTELVNLVNQKVTEFGLFRTALINRDEPNGKTHTVLVYEAVVDKDKKYSWRY